MANILLVDDNPDTCYLLIRLLGHVGHHVECANSGASALEHLQTRWTPELLIVDYMMPHMNGIELLSRLRMAPSTAELPIVLYTASDDPTMHRSAIHCGADDVWLKSSTSIDEMEKRIKRLLTPPEKSAG